MQEVADSLFSLLKRTGGWPRCPDHPDPGHPDPGHLCPGTCSQQQHSEQIQCFIKLDLVKQTTINQASNRFRYLGLLFVDCFKLLQVHSSGFWHTEEGNPWN